MKSLVRVRTAATVVALLGIVAIGVAGFALVVPAMQDQAPAVEQMDGGTCPADWTMEEGAIEGSNAMPPPCRGCKKPAGEHGCTRISCEPCCWDCETSQYPICDA